MGQPSGYLCPAASTTQTGAFGSRRRSTRERHRESGVTRWRVIGAARVRSPRRPFMPVKPDAKQWTVREQIIKDASGLTIQFEVTPSGEYRLRLYGDILPLGNRDIAFDERGRHVGAGSYTGLCRPAWLTTME